MVSLATSREMDGETLADVPPAAPLAGRLLRFFRERPILVLLFFSPGLIEYLTGDTPLNFVLFSPPIFLLELLFNVGIYGPSVLLAREAMLGWKKGWASVLLIGLAYGIVNEGLAAGTLFNANAAATLGSGLAEYGRFAGVSWVWAVRIDLVHALFSISLPILLLRLALPETQGRSLLSRRGMGVAFGVLALDVALSELLLWRMQGFFAGISLLAGSLAAVGLLVLAARLAPRDLLSPRQPLPRARPMTFFAMAVAYFLLAVAVSLIPKALGLPAVVAVAVMLAVGGAWLWWVLRNIGRASNARQLLALVAGLYAPIMVAGTLAQFPYALVLVGDAAFALLLVNLWKMYSRTGTDGLPSPRPPAPA